MKILGIESSCDETAAAIVENGGCILSDVVNTQIDIHKLYGGVVPEIAARSHIEVINPVIDKALSDAKLDWQDIDGVAVTYAPGLIGSLLIGTLAARTIAVLKNKPLYAVHHVEAHVYANFLSEATPDLRAKYIALFPNAPKFPMLSLIISGGHTQLVLFRNHGDYELLGETQDDAIGEAFDKVAKIIGFPYPGGPSIAAAAQKGDPNRYNLPKARLSGKYDFSFSGLKTAVLRSVQKTVRVDINFPSTKLATKLTQQQRYDYAASFQKTAVATLIDKTSLAFSEYRPKSLVIAGGVAANQALRDELKRRLPIEVHCPPVNLCTDNAAMVASLGYFYALKNHTQDPFTLDVRPSLSMTKTRW